MLTYNISGYSPIECMYNFPHQLILLYLPCIYISRRKIHMFSSLQTCITETKKTDAAVLYSIGFSYSTQGSISHLDVAQLHYGIICMLPCKTHNLYSPRSPPPSLSFSLGPCRKELYRTTYLFSTRRK